MKRQMFPITDRRNTYNILSRYVAAAVLAALAGWAIASHLAQGDTLAAVAGDRDALLACLNGQTLRTEDGEFTHCEMQTVRIGEVTASATMAVEP